MIEQHLRESIHIPPDFELVAVETEQDAERKTSCETEHFELRDPEGYLISAYSAWMMDDSFFGFFEYDSGGELLRRKTVGLFAPTE